MRDGTVLRADVYLPRTEAPFPALLERTPYGKEQTAEIKIGAHQFFTALGYAVVLQDVRGRYESEGKFVPLQDDGWGRNRDGYDTVEWIAGQAWCNGQVGTLGGSYPGMMQYRLAPTRPPHLRAMHVREAPADYHAGWAYHGGAFELALMLGWTLTDIAPAAVADEDEARKAALVNGLSKIENWHQHLPLNPNPLLVGIADWYNEYLSHPDDGPYWRQWQIALQHHEIDTPICHQGSWFDCFLNGTLNNFTGLRAKARTAAARQAQRLIVGPWVHGPYSKGTSVQGEVDFGADSVQDINEMRRPWFDYWLKGLQNGVMDGPPVRLFVMGENQWRAADDYPLPNTTYTSWYLRQSGRLSRELPAGAEPADSYVYDPANPVPSLGGCTGYIPGGAFDQRPIEERCIIYTSERLTRDLTVIGNVKCNLYAMSSAPDTDWVVRLTDVHPDGFSRLLCDGILRARYRESPAKPRLLAARQVYEFVVDLWATANVFRAGHRIRVAVTSSCFPRFDRNLNTGGAFGLEAQGQVALNTIFHDAARRSCVILPVID
jgi:putative CocE/NonD family hydrolase